MPRAQNPPSVNLNSPTGVLTNAARPNTRDAAIGANQHWNTRRTPQGDPPSRAHVAETTTLPPNKKNMRANITIATLNMNGLTAPASGMSAVEKWATVNQTLNKYKIAILAIQETHLDQEAAEGIKQTFGRKMHLEYSSHPRNPRTSSGVAFVINKSLIAPSSIEAHELYPSRALALKIKWLETESTTLFNIYAPVNKPAHKAFWEETEKERLTRRLPRPDFMLGDLNVTEDPIDRAPARADDQSATEALRNTRQIWNVQDAWRQSYPEDKKFTYRTNSNGQHAKSRLDRIYVAEPKIPLTFNWTITQTAVPTDHWLVAVKYAPKEAPKIGKGRWTLPLYLLNKKEFIDEVVSRGIKLQSEIENTEAPNTEWRGKNPQQLWSDFKEDIQSIAKEAIGKSHHKLNSYMKRLEKDRNDLANDPNADTDGRIRTNEAYIAHRLESLEKKMAQDKKYRLNADLARHGEKLGGIWSAISKEKKPRDLIRRLRIPDTAPPQYERDSERMADLAKKYHENLQGCDVPPNADDQDTEIDKALSEIPENQTLSPLDEQAMSQTLTEAQTRKALHLTKNGSATGLDGCPYELWKSLQARHEETTKKGKPSFDIIKTMTRILTDIQSNGVCRDTDFALGWMCPIYKKKDKTEISNYRPITLLNTDYKILTKALAIQLMDHIRDMIHRDQAGFIPKRSIFSHIKLAMVIIQHAEATEEDGAIIALDQEKAYDKIRHDYLWKVLNTFNLPSTFIKTIKALYAEARTQVAINGFFSDPFVVTRGIRQGDPLSCALFDLAIEPLACKIRNDPDIKGLKLPGIADPIKAKFFADDTSVYLNKEDSFDHLQTVLREWCHVSGARFNIEKTEVVPIGTMRHRNNVINTRKINQRDNEPLNERVKIAKDGEAIRFLGAWIGNHTNVMVPWEPVIDKINKRLQRWNTAKPTMKGRSTIIQAIIGGMTQFLTMAQGMPENIEKALTKIARKFMWSGDSSPRLALEILQRPINEGGLNLLDISTRNEAIELMWLKEYLDLSPSRQDWARVTDLLINAAAPPTINPEAKTNSFLQTWKPATRGKRTTHLGTNTMRMIKTATKYNTNLAAIKLTNNLRAQLPAWYHLAAIPRPMTTIAAKCLLRTHEALSVADLVRISARIRNPNANQNSPHLEITYCYCPDCSEDRSKGCRNPHACAIEAQMRLGQIIPKLNPLSPGDEHGDLSLTNRRKRRNIVAKSKNDEILFDPSITTRTELAECFRVLTDPTRISEHPARRTAPRETRLRLQEETVYTDGACINNGKANARCGSGIWFAPDHEKNRAFRVPGEAQSNQVGELTAIIIAIETVPLNQPLKIITDSKYAIEGLTTHLKYWEDQGWIGVKNAPFFKKAAYLLKRRTARTSFKWIKGHTGDLGNEGSDRLAKEGAEKNEPDTLDLEIPKSFDLQGAKLSTLNQKTAYKGIRSQKKRLTRKSTDANLRKAREALRDYSGNTETDETIWNGIQNPTIRTTNRQFLYKAMNQTQKVGGYWNNIPNNGEKAICNTCNEIETMDHILTECGTTARGKIWQLAEDLWPHTYPPWPDLTMGIILGAGSITAPDLPQTNDETRRKQKTQGAIRLLQILITESAYTIWVLRCERVIRGRMHSEGEIERRWQQTINKRLIEDKIDATRTNHNKHRQKITKQTWEEALSLAGELPDGWLRNREVLVGRRMAPDPL